MKIILSNCIEIREPTKELVLFCRKKLTYKNPDVEKRKRMGFYTYGMSKEIRLYNEYNGNLYVPVGFFEQLYNFHPIPSDYIDCTISKKADIKSDITLRNYQEFGLKAIEEHYLGLFVLPCGLGKTELALQCAYHLQQKTIWITHTTDLVNQAKDRCSSKMNCKTSTITDGKCDLSGDIVFCTIQTLYKMIEKGKVQQNDFGFLIADECFPSGTKISTPFGYKNIEDIREGDIVYSYNHNKKCIEEKEVDYLFQKDTNTLLKINLSNGTSIICTPNHPIFVNNDYIKAEDIREGDIVYEMPKMWKGFTKRRLHDKSMVLQDGLLQEDRSCVLFKRMWSKCKCRTDYTKKQDYKKTGDVNKQPYARQCHERKGIENTKSNRAFTKNTRWKWKRINLTPRIFEKLFRARGYNSNSRASYKNENEKRKWLSNLLQSRFSNYRKENSNRNRWQFPLCFDKTRTGRKERRIFNILRVESIEVQEQVCDGECTGNNNTCKVYNIGVKDNHNYFANDVLVHNCHRVATNPSTIEMFRTCVDYFACRYKLGLTATLHRADGLHKCITDIIGEVIYEVVKRDTKYCCVYEGNTLLEFDVAKFQVPAHIQAIDTTYNLEGKEVFSANGGTIQFATLISDLAMNKERNEHILKVLKGIKGSTLILSDRVEQLKFLCSQVESGVQIDGGTPKKQREQAIQDVRDGKIQCLFASYSLAKEGLDVPIIENLVMATPVKDFAIVQQSVGRIQRPCGNKKIARVYDFVDDVGMLMRFYTKRRSTYRKNGWKIDNIYLGGE